MSGEICSKETSLDEANTGGGGGGGGEVPPAGEANTGGGGGNNEVPSSGEANTGGDNTSPSDESLVSHLAGGATADVVKQALEHAIAAQAAKNAPHLANPIVIESAPGTVPAIEPADVNVNVDVDVMSMLTRRRRRRAKRRRDDETPNHGGDEPRAASVVAVDAAETASS